MPNVKSDMRRDKLSVLLHTNNDGSGFVLWIKGAATAPIFHHDLAHFISLQCER